MIILKNLKIAKYFYYAVIIVFPLMTAFLSCDKKEENKYIPPEDEMSVDKEKELREREEFERLKKLQEGISDSTDLSSDSLLNTEDSAKFVSDSLAKIRTQEEKKRLVQKEKELNKRLDNPQTAIQDYLEFLKRGTSEGGDFENNMKKADAQWQNGNLKRFTANYKNTKKIVTLDEPKVVSQDGNNAEVEVRIKKTDIVNDKEVETEMTVKYFLIADGNGKWKIKNNTVIKK